MEETNRQKKIAGVLQEDIAGIIQEMLREAGQLGIIVAVSKVKVTTDLSIAKVHLSIFPSEKAAPLLKEIEKLTPQIKYKLAKLTKHQLRKVPDLSFYNDDTLDYIEGIEKAVKGGDNPLENPDLLPKRKKK